MVMSARSGNHAKEGLSDFPKINPKSYSSQMKQINYTKLSGSFSHHIYNKNDRPNHLDPKSAIVPGFSGFSVGDQHF